MGKYRCRARASVVIGPADHDDAAVDRRWGCGLCRSAAPSQVLVLRPVSSAAREYPCRADAAIVVRCAKDDDAPIGGQRERGCGFPHSAGANQLLVLRPPSQSCTDCSGYDFWEEQAYGGTWGKEGVELSRFYAPSRYSVSGVPPNDPQIGPPGTLRPRLRIRAPGAFLWRRGRAILLRSSLRARHRIDARDVPNIQRL